MTNFVNIRMPEGYALDPELQMIVDKLAMNNPRWVFTAPKSVSGYPRGISYSSQTSQPTAPEGLQFVRAIDVKQDAELLGRVYLDTFYGRSATQSWRYNIKCWRVSKERGSRDTTSTTKPETAIRHIKKLFKAKDYTEIMVHAESTLSHQFNDAVRTLQEPISRLTLIKSPTGLQAYALAKALGEPVTSPDLLEVERTLQSDTYKQAMAEYFLARSAHSVYGTDRLRVVIALGNNQYLCRDDLAQIVVMDYDKMSERMQSNVSVLHLMQDNEIVRGVGYRYNDTHFYVIM